MTVYTTQARQSAQPSQASGLMRAARPQALAAALMLGAALCLFGTSDAQATKRSSGVSVQAEVPQKMQLGQTATIRLRISGITAADGASVEVRDTANGRTLLSVLLAKGEERTLELPYTATRDGMQFIDVYTRQGKLASVKSVGIAAGSGAVALKSTGKTIVTPHGEAVISMPALR